MAVETGKRYRTPRGVEFVVTKGGGAGEITDDIKPVLLAGKSYDFSPEGEGKLEYGLGKKYSVLHQDGDDDEGNPKFVQYGPEIIIIKPGKGELCYNGEPMEELPLKVLPSAD